uniref:K Homology domain-containing protein n=1 Tax=Chromera velia CCMP2878 TaxID=1169474 RepID=A0A0G4I9J2_9ALVE|eukprot:Cvel_12177.t1-p1 / transcript=Cvel_12177.t1 / gene=Cvel_12177 / organism=Chromera_velia_CCMP2878 / gene_product=hypothetical protein / transcript_product=hypothetical protein / location=Cvel_scaffold786:44864-47460(-) / protein_length=274 / sequence_SO=supercontig / SO=protein_coding / is_pseudo=false
MEQLSANMVLPLDLLDQGPAPPPVDTAQQEQPQANNNPNGPPAPAQQNPPTQTQTHAGNAASSSGNAVPSASGAPAAAAAAAAGAGQRQDDLLRCKMRIRLPAFHVPRLAGRNADGVSFINEVQQRAEVRISFSRTTDLNGYKTLTVKAADPIRLNTARRLLLNRVAVWTAMRENGPVKENVRVPRAVVGSLIGMRGRAIGELELQSGASVAVENVHIMPPVPIVPGNTRMRGLTLTGTAEAILRCKVLIEAQIQAHRRGDVGFLGRRGTMTAG